MFYYFKYNFSDSFDYRKEISVTRKIKFNEYNKSNKKIINIAIIGASPFAKQVHIPNLKKLDSKFKFMH